MPKGVYPHTHVKPKVYPAKLVFSIDSQYRSGMTQAEIARDLGMTQRVVWRVMHNHNLTARSSAKRDQRGEKNSSWRGPDAGYEALHTRVEVKRGKPSICGHCGTEDPAVRYEWANMTGHYEDVEDFERLCVPCHRKFDAGRRRLTGKRTSPPQAGKK